MPVIVYKTLNLNVLYVQGRRILCDNCRHPFTYVIGDRKTFNVTGVPIVSSDDGMRKQAMKNASKGLAKIARAKDQGQALCPNCKHYQSFMVKSSRTTALGCGFLGGLAIAGALGLVAAMAFDAGALVVFGLAIAGAIVGVLIGKRSSLNRGPHQSQEDGRALRDEDVPGFLQRCVKDGYDPFLFWYLTLGNKTREKEAFLSLGVWDSSGRPPIFPRELNSDFVVGRLQQA